MMASPIQQSNWTYFGVKSCSGPNSSNPVKVKFMVTSFRLSANNWRCASVPSSMIEHIHRARIVFLRKRNHLLLGSNQEVQHSTYVPDSCEMTANNKPCFYKLCPHFRNIVCHHWRNRRKTTYVFTCRIDPLLKPVFPIFGLLGIKSFRTLESFLRGVFCYKCVRTPFLFVRTEPRVSICVPTT